MPLRLGCFRMMSCAWVKAVVGLSLSYSIATIFMFGYFFISAKNPAWRASVVEMPGLTLMTATSPLSLANFAMASAAAAPPCVLFEVMADFSREESEIVVSTEITGILASVYWRI